MKTFILGITGASGSLYAVHTAKALLEAGCRLHIVATDMGHRVMEYETGRSIQEWVAGLPDTASLEDNNNLFASIASGSHPCDGMAVVPCSMSTLGQLAAGITPNLLTRAADVTLKQKRPLVLVPRETPLTSIHLKNMLALAQCGACIVPAMPAYYNHPMTLDDIASFMAGRVLDCFGIENHIYTRWKEERSEL